MVSQPIAKIISDIADWGKANGKKVMSAFSHEGDWTVWARVELALYLMQYQNVTVARDRKLDCDATADLLLDVKGQKKIVVMVGCEVKPAMADNPNAYGDENAYQKVLDTYNALKCVDLSKYRPLVTGLMVSSAAKDTAQVYLCDKQGYLQQVVYKDHAGNGVGLYYKCI